MLYLCNMESKTNDKYWFSEIPGDQLKHLVRVQFIDPKTNDWITHKIDSMKTMSRMDIFRLLNGKSTYKETEAINNLINEQNGSSLVRH